MYRSLSLSLLFCLAEVVEGASGDERWSSIFSAPDFGTVHTLAFMGNGDLIVGGSFARVAEELGTANIARWNGTNWSTVGGGLPGATIYAVLPYGNSVVVGGSFTSIAGQSITNIALWDGTNWNGIGGGLSGGSVRALALHNGTIVAGGLFTRAGAQAAGYIAGWDGAAWVTYGGGVQASSPSGLAVPVQALLSYNGALYAGGRFFAAGGISASNIARWTGTAWEALGVGAENGVNDGVSALAASDAVLYVGGKFTVAGSQPASCLATWNGNAWSPFGLFADPTGPSVTSLLSLPSGELYAGGNITRVDGTNIAGLAKWDGMQWSSVTAPLRHPVARLARFGSHIVASALIENVVVRPGRTGLVHYDGQQWSVIGAGIAGSGGSPYIQTVKAAADRVLVSGYFAIADGSGRRNMVAQWRGAGWTNLGNGLYTAQLSRVNTSTTT